jgi:hypothetical protein
MAERHGGPTGRPDNGTQTRPPTPEAEPIDPESKLDLCSF